MTERRDLTVRLNVEPGRADRVRAAFKSVGGEMTAMQRAVDQFKVGSEQGAVDKWAKLTQSMKEARLEQEKLRQAALEKLAPTPAPLPEAQARTARAREAVQGDLAGGQDRAARVRAAMEPGALREGVRNKLEMVRLQKQLNESEKLETRRQEYEGIAASQGKWAAELYKVKQHFQDIGKSEGFKGLRAAFGAAGGLAGGALLGGGAIALASTASPEAGSTLVKSFELVAIEIGTLFLPAVAQLSFGLQKLAVYLNKLPAQTKDQLGNTAMAGIGLKLGGPVGGIVGLLAGKLTGDNAAGGIAREEFAKKGKAEELPADVRAAITAAPKEKRGEHIQAWAGIMRKAAEEGHKDLSSNEFTWGSAANMATLGLYDANKGAREKMTKAIHDLKSLEAFAGQLDQQTGGHAARDAMRAGAAGGKGKGGGAAGPGQALVADMRRVQPAYMDISQARQRVEMAGLGQSPLDAWKEKALQQVADSWEQLVKDINGTRGNTGDIADRLGLSP